MNKSYFSVLQMTFILAAIVIFLFAMFVYLPFLPTLLGTVISIILTISVR